MFEFDYKKLSAAFIGMSKLIKNNGECSLSSNALMDRFAKSLKLKSPQHLKNALEPLAVTVESGYSDIIDALSDWIANSYKGVLTILMSDLYSKDYSGFIDYLDRLQEIDMYFQFELDDMGLGMSTFSICSDANGLYAFCKHHELDTKEFRTDDLGTRRFDGVDDLMAAVITEFLREKIGSGEYTQDLSKMVFDAIEQCGGWSDDIGLAVKQYIERIF